MMGIIRWVKSMEQVSSNGQMDRLMKENFSKITSMGSESTNGRMEDALTETGKTIKWTEKVFLIGPTRENTKVNIEMTRKKAKATSLGPTADNTLEDG